MTIKKSIHVRQPLQRTFTLFTAELGRWWPLREGFSHGGARAGEIFLEGRVGGRFYERFSDGEEYVVGTVTAFAPPTRVVFTWQSAEWDAPTEVEVRFTVEGDGTRVDLEHRGWREAGAAASTRRDSYNGGWDRVLACFSAAA